MKMKLPLLAGLVLTMAAPLAHAQEEWGDRRHDYMHRLQEDCESGDDEACDRLRHMREEWREEHRRREQEEWRRRQEERRDYEGERDRGPSAPQVDPKAALCVAIETNYNNCLKQHGGRQNECAAWVYELKANHCF